MDSFFQTALFKANSGGKIHILMSQWTDIIKNKVSSLGEERKSVLFTQKIKKKNGGALPYLIWNRLLAWKIKTNLNYLTDGKSRSVEEHKSHCDILLETNCGE